MTEIGQRGDRWEIPKEKVIAKQWNGTQEGARELTEFAGWEEFVMGHDDGTPFLVIFSKSREAHVYMNEWIIRRDDGSIEVVDDEAFQLRKGQ